MGFPRKHRFILAIAAFMGVAALACGSSASGPGSKESSTLMYRLFSDFELSTDSTVEALAEVRRLGDVSQVPVLIEIMRFLPLNTREEVAATLRELSGQSFGANDWTEWIEWHGKHRQEFRPPEGYAAWKTNMLSQIHPRFEIFLDTAEETARIDLTEVTWGGVIPDGIPDLRNPFTIPAEKADYLAPDERVFGVSINGEHRAYPPRIINAHEMANDVLGGEPIALAW